MFKKLFFYIIGFGFGAYLIVNSFRCLYLFFHGYKQPLTPREWILSFIITFSVGVILIIWTCLLPKQKSEK